MLSPVVDVFVSVTLLCFQRPRCEFVTCQPQSLATSVRSYVKIFVVYQQITAPLQRTIISQHNSPGIDSSVVIVAVQITFHRRHFPVSARNAITTRSIILSSSHSRLPLRTTMSRRSDASASRQNNHTSTTLCDLILIISHY